MKTSKEAISILNDLIIANNDRTNGYKKAIEELREEDIDLRILFNQYAIDSKLYANRLENILVAMSIDGSDDTSFNGKMHRVWMDVKAVFTGHDRVSVLRTCEYGEDAIQKVYTSAIHSGADFSDFIYDIIEDQQFSLIEAYKMIKQKQHERASV